MNQVSKRIWGTACQVFHTFGNQTQHQWRGKSHREDKKGQPPNFLWTNCTHLLLAFSLLCHSHCGTSLLLLGAGAQTEPGKTERGETEQWPWNPSGIFNEGDREWAWIKLVCAYGVIYMIETQGKGNAWCWWVPMVWWVLLSWTLIFSSSSFGLWQGDVRWDCVCDLWGLKLKRLYLWGNSNVTGFIAEGTEMFFRIPLVYGLHPTNNVTGQRGSLSLN